MESVFSEVRYREKENTSGFNRCTDNIERICANNNIIQGDGCHIQL